MVSELQTEVTEEVTPVGDAGGQVADAAASETPVEATTPSIEDEVAEYMESLEGKEGTQPVPESRDTGGPDPRLVTQALAEYNSGYGDRQSKLDALEADLEDAGMPSSVAKRFVKEAKDRLNEEHAHSLRTAGYESAVRSVQALHREMDMALGSALPKEAQEPLKARFTEILAKNNNSVPYTELVKTLYEIGKAAGLSDGRKLGYEDGLKKGRGIGEKTTAAASSGQTIDRGSADGRARPWRTKAEAATLHVQGRISDGEMRVIRNNPNIPEI